MTVKDAMARSTETPLSKGMIGREQPGWAEVGVIHVTSGRLTAIDFGVLSVVDGVTVEVPPGAFLVQAKVMGFDGNLGISRARALPLGFVGDTTAVPCGEVSVDFASIAIGDLAHAIVGITDDDFAAVSGEVSNLNWEVVHGEVVQFDLPSKAVEMACISSGLGDGTYSARSLASEGRIVGIEVEFLKDGYVFGEPVGGSRVLAAKEFLAEYERSKSPDAQA